MQQEHVAFTFSELETLGARSWHDLARASAFLTSLYTRDIDQNLLSTDDPRGVANSRSDALERAKLSRNFKACAERICLGAKAALIDRKTLPPSDALDERYPMAPRMLTESMISGDLIFRYIREAQKLVKAELLADAKRGTVDRFERGPVTGAEARINQVRSQWQSYWGAEAGPRTLPSVKAVIDLVTSEIPLRTDETTTALLRGYMIVPESHVA